jgi:hypothetical protein
LGQLLTISAHYSFSPRQPTLPRPDSLASGARLSATARCSHSRQPTGGPMAPESSSSPKSRMRQRIPHLPATSSAQTSHHIRSDSVATRISPACSIEFCAIYIPETPHLHLASHPCYLLRASPPWAALASACPIVLVLTDEDCLVSGCRPATLPVRLAPSLAIRLSLL